ncbi:hypothetical protein C0992_005203 [Termitomyces sp. T32_za158]|nr:hypothetical protein C0992_005203 [Termitomyces sp. T32_za158]
MDNLRYVAVESKTPERSPRKAGLLVQRGSKASASEGRLFWSLKGLFGGSSPQSGESSPAPDDKRRREAESGRRGQQGMWQDDGSSDRQTKRRASVSAHVDRNALTRSAASAPGARPPARKMLTRPAVSPLRSALRNPSHTPSPMLGTQADSDLSNDMFYEADDGLGAEVPRRKSICVSLQPSFRSARDVWEDLSDEDPEYA